MSTTQKDNDDFVSEIMIGYTLDVAIEWIGKNLDPEDVFQKIKLQTWAENNGYILNEE
jgi:hypothetical protein